MAVIKLSNPVLYPIARNQGSFYTALKHRPDDCYIHIEAQPVNMSLAQLRISSGLRSTLTRSPKQGWITLSPFFDTISYYFALKIHFMDTQGAN